VKGMNELNPEKIHVKNRLAEKEMGGYIIPRRYTLTHSDRSGDMFLTIGLDYDDKQTSSFYTKLMRDEILAEWKEVKSRFEFHVYVHISGGLVFGWARMRDRIFRYYLPFTLNVLRYGDNELFNLFPYLDDAHIFVHFNSPRKKYDKIEKYGIFRKYNVM
jgi:hypothetical protein